ncbi:MAG: glucose-6-phosphate isomerase [Candidatus Omnitrophica bacterium]|nr:glucose-6-phosphate isomerase [Candidatus Omnitrophota bacterium]MCB9747323.1 glucose-6-phosphate isomerase [Candidatus Omnitrophota bacterium]
MSITLNREHLKGFVEQKDIVKIFPNIERAHNELDERTGAGGEMTGWTDLPSRIEDKFLDELVQLGDEVRSHSDCLISIGIGGSYLGIRATVEYLRDFKIPVYYAGNNMSVDYLHQLLETVKDKKISVVVISKSGTTTEPAIAFRIIKKFLEEKYSKEELKKRIICVTDGKKGALRKIADNNGYRSYVIPDDVGGRFSILTPVGLVPLAIAGVDIKSLVAGARKGQEEYSKLDVENNIAYQYAAIRYLLYKKGKYIEVTASFYDNMYYVIEWWKQLYGESEAKDGKGIFPSSLIMSTDLHSMGQLMQEGARNVFETFIDIERPKYKLSIPKDDEDLDKFNIVAGKDLDYVNTQAYKATASAHFEGGVPNMTLSLCQSDEFHLGELFYFYERAVAISGYLLNINPFNQPGVEAYKTKMFALLGRV